MISKLLRDSALRFLAAEEKAIAYWTEKERSRGKCCPVNKSGLESLIKAELENLIKDREKIAA
jgi:hypothetical protein